MQQLVQPSLMKTCSKDRLMIFVGPTDLIVLMLALPGKMTDAMHRFHLSRFARGFFHFFAKCPYQIRYLSALFSKYLDVCLHCFLYLLRSTTNPKANISWPGGLRGTIKSFWRISLRIQKSQKKTHKIISLLGSLWSPYGQKKGQLCKDTK